MARTSTQVGIANFDARMKKLGARVYQRSNQGVKDLASVVLNSLIDNTPKKTGQAAANWHVGVGSPAPGFQEGFTAYDQTRAAGLAKISSRQPGQPINISNQTPYISKLNNGSSVQAPAGYVEMAISNAEQFVKTLKVLKDG